MELDDPLFEYRGQYPFHVPFAGFQIAQFVVHQAGIAVALDNKGETTLDGCVDLVDLLPCLTLVGTMSIPQSRAVRLR